MKELIKKQLRHNIANLRLARHNLAMGDYDQTVVNLKKADHHLMSVESCYNFAEKQKLKSQN